MRLFFRQFGGLRAVLAVRTRPVLRQRRARVRPVLLGERDGVVRIAALAVLIPLSGMIVGLYLCALAVLPDVARTVR